MAILTKCLTSISPDLRSGPSPGRRLLAVALCAMLTVGSVFPGVAFASEIDSEGVGTAPEVEVPVVPDFDPGGEETALEETPATGGAEEGTEESATVEVEPELDTEVPVPSEVTGAAPEAVVDEPEHEATMPEVEAAPTEAEYVPQQEVAVEPVENQQLQAPRGPAPTPEAARSPPPPAEGPADEVVESQSAPVEPSEEAPDLASPPSGDSGLSLAGKRFYVVQPGDCLTYIAEALLPAGATESEVEDKVDRLWQLNADRIGTGDRNLIFVGTVLRLR